jgi:hypothetical protein
MKRKRSDLVRVAIPLMVILAGIILYQNVYVRVQSDLKTAREEGALKMKALKKHIALIAVRPDLEKKLVQVSEQRKAADSKILTGNAPALAGASLQETVKSIIAGRGGTISSERIEKPEDAGNFKIITASFDCLLPDIKSLNDILFSLETRTPYLAVREVDTRIRDIRDPRELMVKLTVSALMAGK